MHQPWIAIVVAGILATAGCARAADDGPAAGAAAARAGGAAGRTDESTTRNHEERKEHEGRGIAMESMIRVPVSAKLDVAKAPREGVPDFVFGVHSHGGERLGFGVEEFDWTLEVDSRSALVSLESFRSDGDVPGQPIGVFRTRVGDDELREFHALARAANLARLQPQMSGHPGPTERMYRWSEAGGAPASLVVNDSDHETNGAIAPLRQKLNRLLGASFAHPERSVTLSVERVAGASGEDDRLRVTIANSGIEAVCFDDPRIVSNDGPLHRAVVLAAAYPESEPGGPQIPLDWQPLAFEPARPALDPRDALVTLEPGKSWSATTRPWKRADGERHVAYFSWANYKGERLVDDVYRIRGRADSQRLVIER